jgi:hypothetical protein
VSAPAPLPPPSQARTDGIVGVTAVLNDDVEKRLDEIEMIGEEESLHPGAAGHSAVSAGMRYLHCSRTIHQLVTDRNRAVGVFVAVASLLWTASGAILNARADAPLIVPLEAIKVWSLPSAFGTLTVLALFISFLLIRTRVGLIYEVAKMNVLLGLPVGRVRRISPFSIDFILYSLISLAGGASAALLGYHLFLYAGWVEFAAVVSIGIGVTLTLLVQVLYVGAVLYTTADRKLQDAGR